MTLQKFNEILLQNNSLDKNQVEELSALLDEFPYFQAARALRLKGYYQLHNFKYNKALRLTAAYTLDRSVLFDYITSEEFQQNRISQRITKRYADELKAEQEKEWDLSVQMNKHEAEQVFDPQLFKESEADLTPVAVVPDKNVDLDAENVEKEVESADTNVSLQPEPVNFDKSEQHSFAEWLKLTSVKKIDRIEETPAKPSQKREEQIIDAFIKKAPKIKPSEKVGAVTISQNSNSETNLMTETLAKIYAEQKNFDKAIQSYKILILKNPEKSALFADRIREIENLRENKNK